MTRDFPEIGLHAPSLLLPAPEVPLASWSVIACDQHTSHSAYWQETARLVGEQPSTLHLVLPEAHLGDGDRAAAVAAIHRRMNTYVESGVLVQQPPGFMLVERFSGRDTARRGLVVALDLECFDYREGAKMLIRSTEGTDAGRLPARIAVRRDATLEAPHILVLIDDPLCTVIEPLFERQRGRPAYDFDLMQGGGRVRGWHLGSEDVIAGIANALAALRRDDPPLLYAMGDGNHSFAAARAVWETLKAQGAGADHPGRHALVELVNVYDEALHFAPIHRLLTGVEANRLLAAMAEHFSDSGWRREVCADLRHWQRSAAEPQTGHCIPYLAGSDEGPEFGIVSIAEPQLGLATASLQHFIDRFLAEAGGKPQVDFIHGDDALRHLAEKPGSIGFLLPPMDKHDLFRTVVRDGATPRKTFSLGEAHEKRYYLECRRIQP